MERLNGKDAIMRHLGIKSSRTWTEYKRKGMPVYYHPGGRCTVLASELDTWVKTFKPFRVYCTHRDHGAFASLGPR